MAAPLDVSPTECLQHGTAFLSGMGTAYKLTLIQIGPKFQKSLWQAALELQIQLRRFKGGKAGRIYHLRPAGQTMKLYMAGCMATAAKSGADLPHLELKTWV